MLLEARVLFRERLLASADTELERRLGSLLEGGEGEWGAAALGEDEVAVGDKAGVAETEVGVLLLDTGDQVSG